MGYTNLGKIYEQLQDEESRQLYEKKIDFTITGDLFYFKTQRICRQNICFCR